MNKTIKINPKDIILDLELYPRLKVNDSKVQEYRDVLELMPLIIVNQKNVLIDGAHRRQASIEEEIAEVEVEVVETKDDDDLLLKAIELNASHGFALTQKEKKDQVILLYEKILNDEAQSFDVERLKKTFSIPDSTFSDWTKDLNDKLEAQLLEKILQLHLECKTQQEIADTVGVKQQQITVKLNQINENIKILQENPMSDIDVKYEFLNEKLQTLQYFTPQLYNIWNQSKINNETSHFGNVPIEFTENLMYYYTEPFDIVYDPFAGGGSTIDACEKWFRKYYCSDRVPKEIVPKIKQWEIKDGLPSDLPNNIKLVFLDPPYWKQAENQYSKDKEDLANMDLEDFYTTLTYFVKLVKKKLHKDGKIALIIQGSQWKNNLVLEDHAFEFAKRFEKLGLEIEQRIICPYSTEQYNAQQVIKAKENKICLQTYRDLIVFRLKK